MMINTLVINKNNLVKISYYFITLYNFSLYTENLNDMNLKRRGYMV